MTIWRMRFACWITKATHTHTHTHTQYVIHITFQLQQSLQECASVLHYMYIACLVTLIGVRLTNKRASGDRVSFVFDVL